MNIALRPFTTPNYVLVQRATSDDFWSAIATPSWPLAEVPVEDLAKLCDDFRAEVFKKAGKKDPTK